MKHAALLPALLLTVASCAMSVSTKSASAGRFERAAAAQRARFAAMTTGDVTALDTLLADDLVYIHTSGLTESKIQFLKSLRDRRIVYVAINPSDTRLLALSDSSVIITGRSQMRLQVAAANHVFDIRFTDVLVLRGHRWVTVHWQATRLAE